MAVMTVAQSSGVLKGVVDSLLLKNLMPSRRRHPTGAGVINAQSVGLEADVLRSLANQFGNPRLSLAAMHISKTLFDKSATRHIRTTSGPLLGFPGASRNLFRQTPPTLTKALHCVDAHPRIHNEALLNHFSKKTCKAELYPDWLVERIETEIDLADVLLVPSEIVATQMQTNGVSRDKIALEPYGVDFDLFGLIPTAPDLLTSPTRMTRPKVIYVGQVSRRKGISFLLEAAKNLPIEVELIGNVFDSTLIQSLPSNVTLSKPLGHNELVIKYHSADAFVIPTVEDACSLVALEAAAAGLPVISTTANGATEILPSSMLSLVDPGDVQNLRDMLLNVCPLSINERGLNMDKVRNGPLRHWSVYGNAVVDRLRRPNR